MTRDERVAYESYWGQVRKCRDKFNRWFRYYGGKGIKVEYGPREFIGWWLENLPSFKGTTPTVGRIDHSKNYCFENIAMQDMADNSREALLRNGLNNPDNIKASKKVISLNTQTKEELTFRSIREAARSVGVEQATVQRMCKGKIQKLRNKPFVFKFSEVA
jgi:hypothetical protein